MDNICLNVNEVATAISKYLKVKRVFIDSVSVADLMDQHRPIDKNIGCGGVLNIRVSITEK